MDYKLISLETRLAHIQFPGIFNNKDVIWDTQIHTLKSLAPTTSKQGLKQFIDITNQDDEILFISIALNVNKISTPEILKTIIMINNYKNLRVGRHEYGEVYFFN